MPDEQIIHKLSISTPDQKLVSLYLKTIAQAYNIEWEDDIESPIELTSPSSPVLVEITPEIGLVTAI